jgi:2-methylcitrate dehydratase PrpD
MRMAEAARSSAPVAVTLSEHLAAYWAAASFEDLPPDVVRAAKRFLLDTVAAGICGSRSEVAAAVLAALRSALEGGAGTARVWGQAQRLPAPAAALVNGTAAHALELDDFGGCGHSGAVVIPAVCALAERYACDGRSVLLAIVAGYDLAARTLEGAGGYRPHNDLGWHSTGTCGTFGAAAAAARLLGLTAEPFADALGIAGTYTGGVWAFLQDGAMTKRFHPGKASETGVMAAILAREGMTGPRHILDAEWGGFYSTYGPAIATPDEAVKGLGQEFRIVNSGMKPYACCRGLHAPIDALLEILEETGAAHDDIAAMTVHGNAQMKLQFDRREIGNLLDAQFSMQYSLAVSAQGRCATLDQYQPLRIDDPEIRRLMAATDMRADRVVPVGGTPALEVRFADGRSVERHVKIAKGAPQRPLSDREIERKAQTLIGPVLGSRRAEEIIAAAWRADRLADFREFTALLADQESGIRNQASGVGP